jgi:plastocyanin
MRLTAQRLSPLFAFAFIASLVAFGCGGSDTPKKDAASDAKKDGGDAGDAGSGGKTGTGGSFGTGGNVGTGGSAGSGGTGGTVPADASVDRPDAAAADTKVDVAPDAPADVSHDAAVDLAKDVIDMAPETPAEVAPELHPETTPETAPETTPETAPEVVPETAPEATPETAAEVAPEAAAETAPDAIEQPFVAITPCNLSSNYTTTGTTVTFPTGSSSMQYMPACLKVAKNATVTWTGNFSSNNGHPLEPRTGVGGTSENPITFTSSGTSKSFSFPKAGFFPYRCNIHQASMIGVIWVTD